MEYRYRERPASRQHQYKRSSAYVGNTSGRNSNGVHLNADIPGPRDLIRAAAVATFGATTKSDLRFKCDCPSKQLQCLQLRAEKTKVKTLFNKATRCGIDTHGRRRGFGEFGNPTVSSTPAYPLDRGIA